MTVVLGVVVGILFILAFIGIVIPVIPDAILLIAGLLVYHFFINNEALSGLFWFFAVGIAVLVIAMDYIASSYAAKKYGASKFAIIGVIVGILVFPFILGPFGIIVGPFVMVVLIEMMRGAAWDKALKIGLATVIGFLSGSVIKALLMLFIVIWFLIAI